MRRPAPAIGPPADHCCDILECLSSPELGEPPNLCPAGIRHMHNGGSASRACNRPPPPGCAAPLRCRAHFATVLIGQIAGQGLSSSVRYRGAFVPLHKWPGPRSAHLGAATHHACACCGGAPLAAAGGGQLPAPHRGPRPFYHISTIGKAVCACQGARWEPLGAFLRSATLSRPPGRTLLCAPSPWKVFLGASPHTRARGNQGGSGGREAQTFRITTCQPKLCLPWLNERKWD